MKRFAIIKRAYIWVILSICLAVAWGILFLLTANYSEEFTWWVSISINAHSNIDELEKDLNQFLSTKDYIKSEVHVNSAEDETQIKINADFENDDVVAQLSTDIEEFLQNKWYIESSEDIIWQALTGPSVGDYMKTTAIQALLVGLVLMIIYMLLAFKEIRRYISPAILSVVVLCVLAFDLLVTLGAFGLWMLFNDTIQVDTVFIISVLTVIGYGINDVVVIFDRIRENLSKNKDKNLVYGKVFEESIQQSIRRNIWTSISTLIVLITMFFLWSSDVLQQFSFSVGIGIVASTFSAIFFSGSLAYLMMGKYKKEMWKF